MKGGHAPRASSKRRAFSETMSWRNATPSKTTLSRRHRRSARQAPTRRHRSAADVPYVSTDIGPATLASIVAAPAAGKASAIPGASSGGLAADAVATVMASASAATTVLPSPAPTVPPASVPVDNHPSEFGSLSDISDNNLGNLGPHRSDKRRDMVFKDVLRVNTVSVDMVVSNSTTYYSTHTSQNGVKNGIAYIDLMVGRPVGLTFSFFDAVSGAPAKVKAFRFTLADLDRSSIASETVIIDGLKEYYMMESSTVEVSKMPGGALKFAGTSLEGYDDNPVALDTMEMGQLDKTVGFIMQDVTSFSLIAYVEPGNATSFNKSVTAPRLLVQGHGGHSTGSLGLIQGEEEEGGNRVDARANNAALSQLKGKSRGLKHPTSSRSLSFGADSELFLVGKSFQAANVKDPAPALVMPEPLSTRDAAKRDHLYDQILQPSDFDGHGVKDAPEPMLTAEAATVEEAEVQCASEFFDKRGGCPECTLDSTCHCPGGIVKFGYGAFWTAWTHVGYGSVECTSANFGDPYPDHGKMCMCLQDHALIGVACVEAGAFWWPLAVVAFVFFGAYTVRLVVQQRTRENRENGRKSPVLRSMDACVRIVKVAPMMCVVFLAVALRAVAVERAELHHKAPATPSPTPPPTLPREASQGGMLLVDLFPNTAARMTLSFLSHFADKSWTHRTWNHGSVDGETDLTLSSHRPLKNYRHTEVVIVLCSVLFLLQVIMRYKSERETLRLIEERSEPLAQARPQKVFTPIYRVVSVLMYVVMFGLCMRAIFLRTRFNTSVPLSMSLSCVFTIVFAYFGVYLTVALLESRPGSSAFNLAVWRLTLLNFHFASIVCGLFLALQLAMDTASSGVAASLEAQMRWVTILVLLQAFLGAVMPAVCGAALERTGTDAGRSGSDLVLKRTWGSFTMIVLRWIVMCVILICMSQLSFTLWQMQTCPLRLGRFICFLIAFYFLIWSLLWLGMACNKRTICETHGTCEPLRRCCTPCCGPEALRVLATINSIADLAIPMLVLVRVSWWVHGYRSQL
eukprot:TRINITY_DN24014_c0_g1_i1.p1 TRINITY_DN24014_c0_g1~~TRINITY_DN24014_c0_g1_i1.p1  ORF type:complete len:1125 (+),score=174.73 TRINITY_DN24014_c0_g1_i1:301-3375(+)